MKVKELINTLQECESNWQVEILKESACQSNEVLATNKNYEDKIIELLITD